MGRKLNSILSESDRRWVRHTPGEHGDTLTQNIDGTVGRLPKGTIIGHRCQVGEGIEIGRSCFIGEGAVILTHLPDRSIIGAWTMIHNEAVFNAESLIRIGARCVIREAKFRGSFTIGYATLVDPGADIGRDVRIGSFCFIWENVTIPAGTVIEDYTQVRVNSADGSLIMSSIPHIPL